MCVCAHVPGVCESVCVCVRACVCVCVKGQNGGRKAIFLSFEELLFHGKLKSHYKDYMPANNVRQISI